MTPEQINSASERAIPPTLHEDPEYWKTRQVHTEEDLDLYLAWKEYLRVYEEIFNRNPDWLPREDHSAVSWRNHTQDLLNQKEAILGADEEEK